MHLCEHIATLLKEKGKREARADLTGIQNARDIQSASHALYDALKQRPDHHIKAELTACFQSRILEETDVSRIYEAFEDMYRIYKQSGDPLAMSIAQLLGEKARGYTADKAEKR